ncbi:probable xyloglucan galactosyltransferase GT17 [Eucalyptus grandis]|uniref:probable xyloglucan galactosyltransferase GT17 n=1 Tax=Eucalyptus grandis TaxID=71139 RepID=UPI00192EF532|nr:probable xyloglucan galactosyltransferase GT17 [Eucalyptus grandis]
MFTMKHNKFFDSKPFRITLSLSLFILFSFPSLLLFRLWPQPPSPFHRMPLLSLFTTRSTSYDVAAVSTPPAECRAGVSVYIHDLPPEFNFGLLEDCQHLNRFINMCPHVAHRGLGQPLPSLGRSWFATNQFTSEMLFHARLEGHPCRTHDPAHADLFYVPFYGGFHMSSRSREPDPVVRDALAVRMVEHVGLSPWWQRRHGRDHFITLGRTGWDFLRNPNPSQEIGANTLLHMPAVKNMSVLVVERQPWIGTNQHGLPYPSYFHPTTSGEMLTWQEKMRRSKRPYLFSFIGQARKGGGANAVARNEMMRQCAESPRCELVNCGDKKSKCHNPEEVLRVMTRSEFCLQAPGDSFTRRSTFDALLAGCIPVFSSRHTCYTQYAWFLPQDWRSYSVFIEAEGSKQMKRIEDELMKITPQKREKMRSKVIGLIPRVTYAHPNGTRLGFRDAVDVALEALAKHIVDKSI